ncbi:MAG: hypothetical protein ACP5U0_08725 [Caldisphaera sp.]
MSLFNRLQKAVKRFNSKMSSSIKRQMLIHRTKKEILERFELPLLKDACRAYGIDEPVRYKTSSNENRYRIPPKREDFIYTLLEHLKLEQIRSYANRHKIRVEDIMSNYEKELKEIKKAEIKKYDEINNLTVQTNENDLEFKELILKIKQFSPSKRWTYEEGYQAELQGYLKREFTNSAVEVQTGASRPDIVIDNIAIEIKGPTDNSALLTLGSKCIKYLQHYKKLIIVLFDPIYSEAEYNETIEGIKRTFKDVEVIVKNNY